ncbi:hypothetical protein V498_05128 [Pseudogymnoascus sp. VKM F-4517 (FW-2822)]|nr:hypothetical protein V498_05128 [Pseudogymnoascus sp. VKM F-4517 (FW-2822)]
MPTLRSSSAGTESRNPDRARSNLRSVSHQPQVLAVLGEPKQVKRAGKRPFFQPRRTGPGKFFTTKRAVWEDRRWRFGATDWAAFHSTIRGRLDPNSLQDAAIYIWAMQRSALYIDLRLGDGGKGVLGGHVQYSTMDSTSHARTNLSVSDILKTQ